MRVKAIRNISVFAVSAMALFAAACGDSSEKKVPVAPADQGPKKPAMVFLGDSLTAGRGVRRSQAVPALIQAKVDKAGLEYRVVNAGRSGDTTRGGLSRLPWYLRDSMNMQILVIGLGSNDAMRGQDLKSIETNLRSIIRKTRAAKPKVKIFLWQMHTFTSMGAKYAGSYSKVFPRVARSEKIVLLPFPLRGVGGVAKLNQSDGIHPNVEGTRIVADNLWRDLRKHL